MFINKSIQNWISSAALMLFKKMISELKSGGFFKTFLAVNLLHPPELLSLLTEPNTS